ncbi:MAG TPA: DeoR/GlpR family DNA-binding transcription regulator [Rectinemataceae bacterium]
MASSAVVEKRRARIIQILAERGAVSVADLSAELGVSDITIRRDLEHLQEAGLAERRHGGAQALPPQSEIQPERVLGEKGVTNMAQKTRIAEAAAALISPDDVIFMNSGSTILCLLRAIRGKRVRVITNNAAAIDENLDPSIDLMILGGEYRQQSKSLVGEFALNTLKDIWSTHTFLGTNGVSLEKGLTTSVHQECSVNQAMIRNTHGKVVVLADSSKMGKVANFVSSPLSAIDLIITDSDCPPDYLERLKESGIEVIVV